MKIVKKQQLKIVIFTAVKNRFILHRRVFVMTGNEFLCSYLKSCVFDQVSRLYFLCSTQLSIKSNFLINIKIARINKILRFK